MLSRSYALSSLAAVIQQSTDTTATARTASRLLHWLYLAAAVLAVVLLLVVALAVAVWRRNKSADIGGDLTGSPKR